MADTGWKRHERDVAEFFGTKRALHGLDRGVGEVHTDVFVDFRAWLNENDTVLKGQLEVYESSQHSMGLIVECKYSVKTAKNNHDWPIKMLAEIWNEVKDIEPAPKPILLVRGETQKYENGVWAFARLSDIKSVWGKIWWPDQFKFDVEHFEIRHVDKKMSKFMLDAYKQSLEAKPPEGFSEDGTRHIVCLGTNARLPKVIYWPLFG